MADSISSSNFLTATASLIVAGTGQLLQGRKLMGTLQFFLWVGLWAFMAGWTVTIWSVIDAVMYSG